MKQKYSLAVRTIADNMRKLEKVFDEDKENVIMFDIFLPYRDKNRVKGERLHLTFISEICAWTKPSTVKFDTKHVRDYWTKYDTSGDFYEKLAQKYIRDANMELGNFWKIDENIKPKFKVWIWKSNDKGSLPSPKWMR